jgi:hypothetical protein
VKIKILLLTTIIIATVIFLYLLIYRTGKIDRHALVSRHNVTLTDFNSLAPLSVGNGSFTFTADLTGLQTFGDFYEQGIPLNTMAEWSWHSFPNTQGYKYEDTAVDVNTHGRPVWYNLIRESPAAAYFRANPHRVNLGQIGFALLEEDNLPVTADDLENIRQTLDLWKGVLFSNFEFAGEQIEVETLCPPRLDMVTVRVKSPLVKSGRLTIAVKFPYAAGEWGPMASNWNEPEKHTTRILESDKQSVLLLRQMDDLKYYCGLNFSDGEMKEKSKHDYRLIPAGGSDTFEFCVWFSTDRIESSIPNFQQAKNDCQNNWEQFWTTGGAIDLSQSKDARWRELERRIVLSQYLTATQSAQKYPPAETGLMCNSWFGKFHLEMHWWHGVHFALWDRGDMFEKSLGWYEEILPAAKKLAASQGYAGARWPKMVGPGGQDSPSNIGPLLIWQQPHPIYYAEMVYRQKPTNETLEKYGEIVQQSAEFMASFAHYNKGRKCFELGPPLLSAREFDINDFEQTKNPTFELAYWAWGLRTANQWRQRMGLSPDANWETIAENLASLPVQDGIYVEQETPLVADGGHPCMLAAYGFLPKSKAVDTETMRKTLKYVMQNWNYEETWGWDYPMIAMTAARLGEPNIAIDALLLDTPKNTYLPNGHNFQTAELPIYLPGNGGLLTAVAMMSAGWDGSQSDAPGFPADGNWTVKYEGLKKMP